MNTSKFEQLATLVNELLTSGIHPNYLLEYIDKVIEEQGNYTLWGDRLWMLNPVCSICGSSVPSTCGHLKNPAQKVILRSEYLHKNASSSRDVG